LFGENIFETNILFFCQEKNVIFSHCKHTLGFPLPDLVEDKLRGNDKQV